MRIHFTLQIKSLKHLTQLKSALDMSKVPLKVKKLPDNLYILVASSSFIELEMEPSTGPDYVCTGIIQASEDVAVKTLKTLSLTLHADGIEHLIKLTNEMGKEIASCE